MRFFHAIIFCLVGMLCTAHADEFQLLPAPGKLSPDVIESCSGCCSSHGGITGSCASNGHVRCADGTTSPSCLCSGCGSSPPTHNCSGGTIWNGYACACPSGQVLVGGYCTTAHTCSGGQIWTGSACACPSGQTLVNGTCTTAAHTCSGGQQWNGSACACPSGTTLQNGVCTRATPFSITAGITGTWISAEHNNESGFGIEVLQGNLLLVEWYAYGPNGGQAYVGAIGAYHGASATLTGSQVTGSGAMFPPRYDENATSVTPWGTLSVTFDDCNNGSVSWSSTVPGFGNGSMRIVRLTQPLGLSCP